MADCIAAQAARETAVTGKTHKDQARSWKSCQIGSRLNLKCHLTCMSDLLQTWPTQPIPGRQRQAWIPFTIGTKSIQEGGPKREAPEGNCYVSNISPSQATDLQTPPSHCPVDRIGHVLCILILRLSESPPGQTTSDGTTLHAEHSFFKEGKIIPHTHPDLEFADCISITFKCQKREEKLKTVTQESLGDSVLCPVRFAAGLVQRIWSYKKMDSSTQVSAYVRNGIVEHVT
jgi:hypothetical protein